MNHSFDIDHAVKYGLQEAILITNFEFWIAKNIANGRHEHDGKTWTYNSVKAFEELFLYLTGKQIRRAVESLVEQGVLVRGNYNPSTYDRTSWFAFSDSFVGQIHLPAKANGSARKGKSLIGTDVNADVNTDTAPEGVEVSVWSDFLKIRKAKRAPMTDTALKVLHREADKAGVSLNDALVMCCNRGWQGFEASWVADKNAKPGQGKNTHKYAGAARAIWGDDADDSRTINA